MHLQRIQYHRARNVLTEKDNIFTTGGIWMLLVETIILLFQPYPFLKGKFSEFYHWNALDIEVDFTNIFESLSYYYNVNDFLSMLTVCRVYIIVRSLMSTTVERSPRGKRVA